MELLYFVLKIIFTDYIPQGADLALTPIVFEIFDTSVFVHGELIHRQRHINATSHRNVSSVKTCSAWMLSAENLRRGD